MSRSPITAGALELPTYTAFQGARRLAAGPLNEVALAMQSAWHGDPETPILAFDDATGAVVDVDLRGSPEDLVGRLAAAAAPAAARTRGRPKLGVVGREVTLLPRQWDWLAEQPGGASVVLRRLVDEARRSGETAHRARLARERAYRFMAAMGGDLPGFEEATRALFSGDRARLEACMAPWPADIRDHALGLASEPPRDGSPAPSGASAAPPPTAQARQAGQRG